MRGEVIELGVVTVPSGVLVLAMAGHLDHIWPRAGNGCPPVRRRWLPQAAASVGPDRTRRHATGSPMSLPGHTVLRIGWDPGDHSMRHRGERAYGHVYPVTASPDDLRGPVLRWTIAPYGQG
jgi:hypothetical protein